MKLCGIDSSTSATSVSLFKDGKFIDYKLIRLDKKKYPSQWERINPMMEQIWDVLNKYDPDVIYQEDTYQKQSVDTLKCLTNILGGVRMWAVANHKEYYKINAPMWRAQLKMNEFMAERPELKDKSINFIKEKFNINPETDDVADSICIGLAGLKIYES